MPVRLAYCERASGFKYSTTSSQSRSTVVGTSLFCKKRISVTVSVKALDLNAVFGNLIAPISSAFSDIASLILLDFLSSVPEDVIKATIPFGRTISSDLRKK